MDDPIFYEFGCKMDLDDFLCKGNLNRNRYVREVLQPESFPFFKASLELSFIKILHAHM